MCMNESGGDTHLIGWQVSPEMTLARVMVDNSGVRLSLAAKGVMTALHVSIAGLGEVILDGMVHVQEWVVVGCQAEIALSTQAT